MFHVEPNERVVVFGPPGTGKTTICEGMENVWHTDDCIGMGWNDAKLQVAAWMDLPGPWIIEGIQTARALRYWLSRHPAGKPCDRVVVMHQLKGPGNIRGTARNRVIKGLATIFAEIALELRARGVKIVPEKELHGTAQPA